MKVKIGRYPKNTSRKIDIVIDRYDTWGLDSTLSFIILPCLLQLKATKQGVPAEFGNVGGGDWEYDQHSFDFYKDTYRESFEESVKKWEEILDKMIWSFSQLTIDDYDDKYHHGEPKYKWVETGTTYPNPVTGKLEKTYEMVDTNPDEHWYDSIGHRLHEEKIQEGIDLFAKYYRALWD